MSRKEDWVSDMVDAAVEQKIACLEKDQILALKYNQSVKDGFRQITIKELVSELITDDVIDELGDEYEERCHGSNREDR